MDGKSVKLPGGDLALAAIDTGTTLIGGPTAAVDALWNAVPGSVPLSGNLAGMFAFRKSSSPPLPSARALWNFDSLSLAIRTACSSQLSIAFSFGGPSWPINLADLNLGSISNGRCLGAIFDITQGSGIAIGNGQPAWIIGDTFLV